MWALKEQGSGRLEDWGLNLRRMGHIDGGYCGHSELGGGGALTWSEHEDFGKTWWGLNWILREVQSLFKAQRKGAGI